MAHTAVAAQRVTFTKWTLQIAYAGVTENDTHVPGEPQPTCEDDQLRFAGVAGRYRGFDSGSTVSGVFVLDGRKVGFAGPYTTSSHGTFGLTWQPKQPVAITGTHTLELRFFVGKRLVAQSRQRFVPGGVNDCG